MIKISGHDCATMVALAGLAAVACGVPQVTFAQDFYAGKQVTLFVGYAPGGGYDTFARTLARHIANHIPGKPAIVVKNQPGAGSLKLANYLFNSAPKDGRELGAVGREVPTASLLGQKNAQFRSLDFTWIGSLSREGTFCIAWHTTPFTKAEDMFEKEFIVGGTTGRSLTIVVPIILNNLLKTKIKVITGYPGGASMHLAMERGEIQGRCSASLSSIAASRADWIRDKKIRFLLDISLAEKRRMPDVPLVTEFAKRDEDRKALEVLLAPDEWTRPYVAPPGLPAERVATLRKAFAGAIADPAFLKDIERQKLHLDAMSGEEMERRIKALHDVPAAIVKAAIEASLRTDTTPMAQAVIPIETAKGKISKVANGGRKVSFAAGEKKGTLSVSTSGTKVSIAGKAAKRDRLKAGMACEFTFQGSAAKAIACE